MAKKYNHEVTESDRIWKETKDLNDKYIDLKLENQRLQQALAAKIAELDAFRAEVILDAEA